MAKKKDDKKPDKEDAKGEDGALPPPGPDIPEGVTSVERLPVVIHAQYIKDLSFENPNAPMPLRKGDGEPTIDVDFSMDAKKVEVKGFTDPYEVMLHVTAHARKGDMTTFIAEVEYGMMVTVHDVPVEKIHPLLLIEMPHYMFPYVRQIVSELTQQAGYLPFLLSPVNFKALYRQRFGGPQVKQYPRTTEKKKESA